MTLLENWARDHGVSLVALKDLELRLGLLGSEHLPKAPEFGTPKTESDSQKLVQFEASEKGCRLMRNNNGACYDNKGHFIQYGLGNEGKLNKTLKSPDLVGVRPVVITHAHIGTTIGQLLLREMKEPGWRFTGKDGEQQQLDFLLLMASFGADAAFATGWGTI